MIIAAFIIIAALFCIVTIVNDARQVNAHHEAMTRLQTARNARRAARQQANN